MFAHICILNENYFQKKNVNIIMKYSIIQNANVEMMYRKLSKISATEILITIVCSRTMPKLVF